MDISKKMKNDWNRRAAIDPLYWVEAVSWQDEGEYISSAVEDTKSLIEGVERFISKKSTLLDIGCGTGRMMSVLADKVAEVHGVDVSSEMIMNGKKRLSDKKNVYFYETNGTDLEIFEKDRFDFVYSYAALPHISKELIYNYFLEISRVLKKGGMLKVQMWIGISNNPYPYDTLTPRVVSEKELTELYLENGFYLVEIKEQEYRDPVLKINPVWCTFENRRERCGTKKAVREKSGFTGIDDGAKTESDLLVYYGNIVMEKGGYEKAKEAFTSAIDLNPKAKEAYNCLAALLLEQGNVKEAIRCLEMAVDKMADYSEGRRYLEILKKYYIKLKGCNIKEGIAL